MLTNDCIIFSGGELKCYEEIDLSFFEGKTIISADAGYIHAKKLGIRTNIAIGDFDSLTDIPRDVDEVIIKPKEKDDTDTMLAVKLAIQRGFKHITIYGALGGRLDHTYSNIQALAYIIENGGNGIIIGDNDIIHFVKNSMIKLDFRADYSLSIFAFAGTCEGVTISGVKYPTDNITLKTSFPIGACNEIIKPFAEISVKSGILMIILSKTTNQIF